MTSGFIELILGNHIISHGYDDNNKEILEDIQVENPSKKLVSIQRIKSISEKYILIDYLDDRWVYWEYDENYQSIKKILTKG